MVWHEPEAGRPRFVTEPPSFASLRALPIVERLRRLQSMDILEKTAKQQVSIVCRFADTTMMIPGDGPVEPAVAISHYLASLIDSPLIQRSTTILQHLVVLEKIFPRCSHWPAVAAVMSGIAQVSPLSPEQAGVHRTSAVDEAALMQEIVRLSQSALRGVRWDQILLRYLSSLLAGIRPAETVRSLIVDSLSFIQVSPEQIIVRIVPVKVKDDKHGKVIYTTPRFVVVDRLWARALAAPVRALALFEQPAMDRDGTALARRFVSDMRAFRRRKGELTALALARSGLEGDGLLEAVRQVLGHAPGSASTIRYLGRALDAARFSRLVQVARDVPLRSGR